jgi:hypothetical protein
MPVLLGNALNWPDWKDAVRVDSERIGGSETYHSGCHRKAWSPSTICGIPDI